MKLRSAAVLLATVAGLSLVHIAPVQAASTDPVTDLAATVVQAPGSPDSWKVSVSWTANPDATSYRVVIADQPDGTVSNGSAFGNKDTSGTSVDITSSNFAAGVTYWATVRPIAPATGEMEKVAFVPPALDTTAPTGSFTLDRTKAYLTPGDDFESLDESATFVITQTALGEGAVTKAVIAGDGSAPKPWTAGTRFGLLYTTSGSFSPKVRLTDEFGNVQDVALPTVSVLRDTVAPKIKITRPARPGKIASWRTIRGTSSDAGVGMALVGTFVAEKRGKLWWTYDFAKKRWLKGYTTLKKSMARSRATPAIMEPSRSGAWKTPAIRKLTKGTLYIEAIGLDQNFNLKLVKLSQKIK